MLAHGHIDKLDYDTVCTTIKEYKQQWCDDCEDYNSFTGDPFDWPFPDDAPSDLGYPFDTAGADSVMTGLVDTVMRIADEEGMTQEQLLDSLEEIGRQFEEELALYDADDDAVLAKLEECGLAVQREELEQLMRSSLGEYEVAGKLFDKHGIVADPVFDLVATAVDALWQRWLPDDPSETTLFAHIDAGYTEFGDGDQEIALEEWDAAWHAFKRCFGMYEGSLEAFSQGVSPGWTIEDWLEDYESLLEGMRSAKEVDAFVAERDEILAGRRENED